MAEDTITLPKGFALEAKPPEGFVLEGRAGFSDVASPNNWPDMLPPAQRTTFDALDLDDNQKNDMFDTLYFADAYVADPNDVDVFLPDIRKELDFHPHKDIGPYDDRKRLSEAVKHGYRRGGVMMVKQLAGIAQAEVELGGRFRDWFWKKTPLGKKPEYIKGIEGKLKEWSDMMLAGVEEYYRAYPEEAIQIAPELGYLATIEEYVTKPENLIQAILESAPLMLEGILGGVTGGLAGTIALMGTPISGEVYSTARSEGTEPLPAFGQAILTGYGEATIESWTLSRKLGLLKGFRKLIAGGLPKILWEGTKAFFRGTAEEGSQEFNRNFWRWVFTDRSQDWLANVKESMAAGGPIEMVMAGGFAAAGAVATPVSKSQQTERVEQIRTAVNASTELSDTEKTEINAELDRVAKDVDNDVYVEAEKAPVAPEIAPEAAEAVTERKVEWAIRLKDGSLVTGDMDAFTNHADLAVKKGVEVEQIESAGFVVAGEYNTQTKEGERQERVDLIKKKAAPEAAKPEAKEPAPAKPKEPWEMDRAEFEIAVNVLRAAKTRTGLTKAMAIASAEKEIKQKYGWLPSSLKHTSVVQKALKEGEPVPRAVLEEYKGEKWADEALRKPAPAKPKAKIPVDLRLTAEEQKEYKRLKELESIMRKKGLGAIARDSPEGKRIIELEEKMALAKAAEPKKAKLRQQIHAIAATKGLTKKALTELKKKHTGYNKLTGTIAEKKISTEQLQSLLAAVRKARPKIVEHKKVLTKKQENKIASLKENLIRLKHLTEADYADILQRETRGKEAKYIDAKNFITQAEATAVIRRIHNQAEITRVVEARESAVRDNTEIAQTVDAIDKMINDKRAKMRRDPWQFESIRYYNEQMELKTGAPFYALYQDLTDTHLESTKTRTARLVQLSNEVPNFEALSKDEKALERVSLYISSQSRLKTPAPVGITTEEIAMAKAIQKIFSEYEGKARWTRFYWWYITGQQTGPYPIGDYEQNKEAISKAVDIYESKGKDAVIEYLETQKWGIIKSGYEPLEIVSQKVRLYKLKPTTVGKSHIEVRTAIEYHEQDRHVLRRLGAYMRQLDMLNDLSPKINAYIQLFEDNQGKFNNPARVKESVENYMQTLKRYNIEGGFWGRITARLYAQAMRTIIMPSPVLSFRNLFQNAAFEHDKSILIDPRNKALTAKDVEYLETYVQQQRAMIEEYFMMGEKPLPGLKAISQLVDHVKLYPVSDVANRRWSFWAKMNQVRRALTADTNTEMMREARFADMSDMEQRMALSILAKEGKEAMARFVSRVHVADIHFLYERVQRAPVEMGGGLARIYGNLMLFPRAYGEKLARNAHKMLEGTDSTEQWRAAKVLMAVIGGGLIAGAFYKRITGRKRNPYNPLVILSWRPGGLAQGAIDAVGEGYSNMIMAASGDDRALAAFLNSLPGTANMFVPFYDIGLRGIEAVTDQKNIDYKFVRQMRAAIDKEYKIRGGAYKLKRDALQKWQYFIGGAGVDAKAKKKKPKPIKR